MDIGMIGNRTSPLLLARRMLSARKSYYQTQVQMIYDIHSVCRNVLTSAIIYERNEVSAIQYVAGRSGALCNSLQHTPRLTIVWSSSAWVRFNLVHTRPPMISGITGLGVD